MTASGGHPFLRRLWRRQALANPAGQAGITLGTLPGIRRQDRQGGIGFLTAIPASRTGPRRPPAP